MEPIDGSRYNIYESLQQLNSLNQTTCSEPVISAATIHLFIWLPIVQYSIEILVFLAIMAWALITKRSNTVSNIFLALITSSAVIQVAYYFTWNLTFVSLSLSYAFWFKVHF